MHDVIGRMGTHINAQGEVIDRIDANLMDARGNMDKGNRELRSRLRSEEDVDDES